MRASRLTLLEARWTRITPNTSFQEQHALIRSILAILRVLLTFYSGGVRARIGQIALDWLTDDDYEHSRPAVRGHSRDDSDPPDAKR